MNSNDNFHIIENMGLIVVSHDDMFSQEKIKDVILDLVSNPFFKRGYDVLIDIRNSVIILTSKEIEVLRKFIINYLKEFGINKFALLSTSSRINTAVEFVRHYRQSSRYRVFSSTDDALYWLGIPYERKPQVKIVLTYLEENYMGQLN